MYLETGVLSWNGNGVIGSKKIVKFLMDLPGTDHTITTLDSQPILGKTFVVTTSHNT